MFWQHTIENELVEFNSIPFAVSEVRRLDCQFGKQYFKEKPVKSNRTRLQGTRKMGCPAHITVKTLTLFPEYAVEDPSSLGPKKLKESKRQKLDQLRTATEVKTEKRYYVVLPTKEAHHSVHPTEGAIGYAQGIHPKLVEKIQDLVAEGITNVPEVTRALKYYVNHTLCPDSKPDISDRAYYPTADDIRNHIYRAQKSCQLSHLDQENLRLKVEQWKKEDPKRLFLFRPFTESEPDLEKDSPHTSEAPSPSLLFIHQDPWQQQLLIKYGNTISLLDATYKTTKYELPLFFLSVKTNVGYSVVAEFIIQSETTPQISEALKVLSTWNPTWKPKYFMTDYCDAEMSAIEEIFPSCQTYLCDFHREQCWERWVKDRKHGLSQTDAEVLLSLLRNCAHAEPEMSNEGTAFDHNYQQQVEILKQSYIWEKNQQVREWLKTKWLSVPQVLHVSA